MVCFGFGFYLRVFSLFHVEEVDGLYAPAAAAANFDSNIDLEEEEAGRVNARLRVIFN